MKWFDFVIAEPEKAQKLTEEALWAVEHDGCFSLATYFQSYITEKPPKLEPVKQPTLIIWGECDASHKQTDKSQTRQLTLDYEEVYIHTGHYPEVESPEIFAEAVKKLLN